MACDGLADDILLKLSGAKILQHWLLFGHFGEDEASMLKSQTLCLIVVGRGEGWKESIAWKPEHKFIGFL